MLCAPRPKSAKISEYFLENGSLILRSEAQTLRLTPVSDKILRISALPDGVPSDDIPPEILPYSNSCEFKLSRDGKSISFSSGELKTVISEETGSIEYFGPSGLYLREAKRESRLFDGYKAKRRFGGSTKKVMTADGEKTVVVSGEEEIIGDFYHMNIEEDNLAQALHDNRDLLGHVHIADNHRYQPGSGTLDFHALFEQLRADNYQGYVVYEGRIRAEDPAQAYRDSLAWLRTC